MSARKFSKLRQHKRTAIPAERLDGEPAELLSDHVGRGALAHMCSRVVFLFLGHVAFLPGQ